MTAIGVRESYRRGINAWRGEEPFRQAICEYGIAEGAANVEHLELSAHANAFGVRSSREGPLRLVGGLCLERQDATNDLGYIGSFGWARPFKSSRSSVVHDKSHQKSRGAQG